MQKLNRVGLIGLIDSRRFRGAQEILRGHLGRLYKKRDYHMNRMHRSKKHYDAFHELDRELREFQRVFTLLGDLEYLADPFTDEELEP